MIIRTSDGLEIDTARDLAGPERHILQKLFGWQSLAGSLAQFREKTRAALMLGWNGSGPIKKSPLLSAVIRDMERKVAERLEIEEPFSQQERNLHDKHLENPCETDESLLPES